MKRAYTILFVSSLAPLVGLSWLAASFGLSTRMFVDPSVIGLVVAAIAAGIAMHYNIRHKFPAQVAVGASGLWAFKLVVALSLPPPPAPQARVV